MHLPLLQKAMKLWWFNSLFKQHPSHNSSPRLLNAFNYSFFFSFCLSSLLISLLAMEVYFVMMPCWFKPGKSSRKLTVGKGKGAYIRSGFDHRDDQISYQTPASNMSKPHPPKQELRYSEFIFSCSRKTLSHDGPQITAASTNTLNLALETEHRVCRAAVLKVWLLNSNY